MFRKFKLALTYSAHLRCNSAREEPSLPFTAQCGRGRSPALLENATVLFHLDEGGESAFFPHLPGQSAPPLHKGELDCPERVLPTHVRRAQTPQIATFPQGESSTSPRKESAASSSRPSTARDALCPARDYQTQIQIAAVAIWQFEFEFNLSPRLLALQEAAPTHLRVGKGPAGQSPSMRHRRRLTEPR